MKAYEEIYDAVSRILVDVPAVDRTEVTPQATFFDDLDGESIDLLETQFQIRKELAVDADLSKLVASSAIRTDASGAILPESLRWLRDTYPFLKCDCLPLEPTPESLKMLLTVEAIARFVEHAQAGQIAKTADASQPALGR